MKSRRPINVFFNKLPENDFDLERYFPFEVLFKHFDVKVTNNPENADIIFEMTIVGGKSFIDRKDKIVVIVSGENIFMRRTLFIWIERFMKLFVGNEEKYKIMDFLDKVIPYSIQDIQISQYFKKYIDFINSTNGTNNKYVIWCNGERKNNKNIYNYPLFLADFHYKIDDLTSKRKYKQKKNFCAFAVSSNSSRERVKFFRMLSRYKKVDSYGRVMNNIGPKFIGHWRNNPSIFSKYKFVICFENSFVDDFVTEKITNVMLSGAIPIYRGPKTVNDYFNTSSFINYEDYGSYKSMIRKIIELDKNPKEYRKMVIKPWTNKTKIKMLKKRKEEELVRFYKNMFAKKIVL